MQDTSQDQEQDSNFQKVEKHSEQEQESFLERCIQILQIAIPCTITSIIITCQDMVDIAFLGHLDNQALIAGVGIANVCVKFMGMIVINGLNNALDTLISQSFGAGNLELCGVYLNRGRFIITCVALWIAMLTMHV